MRVACIERVLPHGSHWLSNLLGRGEMSVTHGESLAECLPSSERSSNSLAAAWHALPPSGWEASSQRTAASVWRWPLSCSNCAALYAGLCSLLSSSCCCCCCCCAALCAGSRTSGNTVSPPCPLGMSVRYVSTVTMRCG